ncbi:MAG: 1-acyl-sn-glycerol-3-phosphate acyltransferase [Lachnospiraceae bacterium]|nr:1-acyl-sn-glycerol-3-phosphate acyltransferase [Lachnospiraceae bacterium]
MKWFYDFVKVTAAIPLLLWYRPRILYAGEKRRLKGGALVIANHIGLTDPILVMLGIWYRRLRFVCMKEFWEKPISRWFFSACMCIPIDRKNVEMETFREITGSLEKEQLVAIFPGGHVDTETTGIGEFKSGMVLMAIRGKQPIVPMYLKKRAHYYERQTVVIGEPVDIRALYGERPRLSEIDEVVTLLMEKMAAMQSIAQNKRR